MVLDRTFANGRDDGARRQARLSILRGARRCMKVCRTSRSPKYNKRHRVSHIPCRSTSNVRSSANLEQLEEHKLCAGERGKQR